MLKAVEELDYLTSLEKIINAYEEIAANRMQNIKKGVLENREHLTEINQIFQIVKNSYQKQVVVHKTISSRNKIQQTARVFISANTGLYGDLISRVFTVFRQDLKDPGEAVIIGQLGKVLMEKSYPGAKFTYFNFPDAKIDFQVSKRLIDYLMPYEQVVIYHGLFKNIVMQEASSSNITGDFLLPETKESRRRQLIFEPSLVKILEFFETEIFASLLVQTIYESQLAKFSSRMASLDQATDNISRATRQALWENSREKHRLVNRKQLGMLAGRQLW